MREVLCLKLSILRLELKLVGQFLRWHSLRFKSWRIDCKISQAQRKALRVAKKRFPDEDFG